MIKKAMREKLGTDAEEAFHRGALAVAQLDKLKPGIERRLDRRRAYMAALRNVSGIHVPYRDYAFAASHYIFPVVLKQGGAAFRDRVRGHLADAGVETSVHYPAVHRFSYYAPFTRALPRTEFVADHEITLPLYEGLTDDQLAFVVETFEKALAA